MRPRIETHPVMAKQRSALLGWTGRPRFPGGLEVSPGWVFGGFAAPELGSLCDPSFGVSPLCFKKGAPKIGVTKRPHFWGQGINPKVVFSRTLRPSMARLPRARVAHKKFGFCFTTGVPQGMGERFDPRIGVTRETAYYIWVLIKFSTCFRPQFWGCRI